MRLNYRNVISRPFLMSFHSLCGWKMNSPPFIFSWLLKYFSWYFLLFFCIMWHILIETKQAKAFLYKITCDCQLFDPAFHGMDWHCNWRIHCCYRPAKNLFCATQRRRPFPPIGVTAFFIQAFCVGGLFRQGLWGERAFLGWPCWWCGAFYSASVGQALSVVVVRGIGHDRV